VIGVRKQRAHFDRAGIGIDLVAQVVDLSFVREAAFGGEA
jgi:hypothetical protein